METELSATASTSPRPRWWQLRLRERLAALKAEHTSPTRLGVAIGVGVFWACTPFYGLQTLLALGMAWLFRLNKLAVLIGLQLSLPPMMPVLIFAGIQTGELLLHGRLLPLSFNEIRNQFGGAVAKPLIADFMVGSVVVGAVLGLAIGLLTMWLAQRHQRRRDASAPVPAADQA